jgi:hypothetical protein
MVVNVTTAATTVAVVVDAVVAGAVVAGALGASQAVVAVNDVSVRHSARCR